MRALVVDDSFTTRKILRNLLSQISITDVDEAENGDQAVLKIRANEYSVVLLDWNMPKLSGMEVLREVRRTGSKVPIIMVTTEAEKTHVIQALKEGANNYAIKPINKEALLAKITRTLEKTTANASG